MKFCKFKAIIIISCILFFATGCRVFHGGDPQRKAEKKQYKEAKKADKAYAKGIKRQYDIQSKDTKKRMKKNLRKANKRNKSKKSKSKWNCSK